MFFIVCKFLLSLSGLYPWIILFFFCSNIGFTLLHIITGLKTHALNPLFPSEIHLPSQNHCGGFLHWYCQLLYGLFFLTIAFVSVMNTTLVLKYKYNKRNVRVYYNVWHNQYDLHKRWGIGICGLKSFKVNGF